MKSEYNASKVMFSSMPQEKCAKILNNIFDVQFNMKLL